MIQGVNIEEVKRYNASLKQYKERASQVRAGIEYSTKELERLCAELSTELGVVVTPENIQQIRQERLEKIQNTLTVGNEILNRIKSEEEAANAAPVKPAYTPNPVMGAAPTTPNFGSMPQMPQTPQAPQAPQGGIFENLGSIPPIFGKQG